MCRNETNAKENKKKIRGKRQTKSNKKKKISGKKKKPKEKKKRSAERKRIAKKTPGKKKEKKNSKEKRRSVERKRKPQIPLYPRTCNPNTSAEMFWRESLSFFISDPHDHCSRVSKTHSAQHLNR
jgi:outer membrane biosynthesis protein TonB